MITPDTLTLWLREQALPLGIIAASLVIFLLILKVSARRRQQELVRQRFGMSEETFTTHLQRYGFDPIITAATYRYLEEVQLVRFPILPADALDEDLGLDSEDVEQTVRELTQALHRKFAPGLQHRPLVTVEDLVRLLQASPRKSEKAAA